MVDLVGGLVDLVEFEDTERGWVVFGVRNVFVPETRAEKVLDGK
jgi:hypothetical protein